MWWEVGLVGRTIKGNSILITGMCDHSQEWGFGEGGRDMVGGGAGRKDNERKLDSHHRHV